MNKKYEDPEFQEYLNTKIKEYVELHFRPANEIIIDDVQLLDLLHISRRTSISYRESGKLKNHKVGGKIFYFLSDVHDFIKKHGGSHD